MSKMEVHCLYDKLVRVSELKEHPKNRNVHPQDQIDRLAKILKYQGWRAPVKVSKRSGLITAGHGRLMAARHAGWKEVPVNFQDYDSDEQEYADLQADNAIALWADLDLSGINADLGDLGPDFDLEMLGMKDFELVIGDTLDPQCDEDEIPEFVEPKSKLGDIYQLGRHRLMCGSATSVDSVSSLILLNKIDLVLTDPPYGVDVVKKGKVGFDFGIAKKGNYSPVIGDDTTDTAKEFYQTCVSLEMERFIIWGGNYFTSFLQPSNSWVIWNKRGDSGIRNTFADAELAWSNVGFPARVHNQLWNGFIREGEKDKRVHPTQKPVSLAQFCLDLSVSKNVYDGFGGSGSTLIACEKTNRNCFMMELDPKYCSIIVARWEKYTGKQAELVPHG